MYQTKLVDKQCKICGAELKGVHYNTQYCPECKKELEKKKKRDYAKKQRDIYRSKRVDLKKSMEEKIQEEKERARARENTVSIEELSVAASQAKMSYGRYVQMQYMKSLANNKQGW